MGVLNRGEHCMLCGGRLEYRERPSDGVCAVCGAPERGHVSCPNGHVVCERCHGAGVTADIKDACRTTGVRAPLELAEELMTHPRLPMLGCEHAYIAAGALQSALDRSPYAKKDAGALDEVFERTARQAHGGYCGLTGICGIAPAVGAVFSVYLGARCGSDVEQRITMEAVSRTVRAIADLTGPSCCKAYVRAALDGAVILFRERLGVTLPTMGTRPVCRHSAVHPHACREERCPYFDRAAPVPQDLLSPLRSCGPS